MATPKKKKTKRATGKQVRAASREARAKAKKQITKEKVAAGGQHGYGAKHGTKGSLLGKKRVGKKVKGKAQVKDKNAGNTFKAAKRAKKDFKKNPTAANRQKYVLAKKRKKVTSSRDKARAGHRTF
ncbi:MAG: hypothetical protein MPJ25_05360 [Pirellulales bacterium]|nr:hypothetical protein [Pirellulales bacterium]